MKRSTSILYSTITEELSGMQLVGQMSQAVTSFGLIERDDDGVQVT